jgi:hypothetical protein
MHGYSSATAVRQIAEETADQTLIAFYVGDWDPSGLHMSEVDLPQRLREYGAKVILVRVALDYADVANSGLPYFAVETKRGDTRYQWFVGKYGERCYEVDALDPNVLRARVEHSIRAQIDFEAWDRCKVVEAAEHRSLIEVMKSWREAGIAP